MLCSHAQVCRAHAAAAAWCQARWQCHACMLPRFYAARSYWPPPHQRPCASQASVSRALHQPSVSRALHQPSVRRALHQPRSTPAHAQSPAMSHCRRGRARVETRQMHHEHCHGGGAGQGRAGSRRHVPHGTGASLPRAEAAGLFIDLCSGAARVKYLLFDFAPHPCRPVAKDD